MNHTILLKEDGTVWVCGQNDYGQLGNNSTTNQKTLVQMQNSENVKQIACGYEHTLILKEDGTVWACGYNYYGQLGLKNTNDAKTLTQIPNATNVRQIACGNNFTLILKEDGTVWGCGRNNSGQLGLGHTNNVKTLTQIPNASNVRQIACGNNHTLILKEDGTVWGCGYNYYSQLGDDATTTNQTLLIQIQNATNVKAIACGSNHTLILKEDGTVWSCGRNSYGQLGLGNNTDAKALTQIPNASNIKQIACGYEHTLILKNDGTVWGCGYNSSGQLGNNSTTNQATPIQIPNATYVKQIACGYNYTLLLKEYGTVFACGRNDCGQLGTGDTNNRLTLTQIPKATNVKMLMNVTPNDILFLLYANEKYYSFSEDGIYEVDSVDKINENGFINLNLINNYLFSTPKESLPFDSYKIISTDEISAHKGIYNKSYMIIPNNSITMQDVLKIQNNIISCNSSKYDIFYTFSLDDGNTWKSVDSNNNLVSFPNFTMPTSTTSTEWNTLKTLVLKNGIKSTNTSFTILNNIYDSISFRIILVIKMKKYIQDDELTTNGITSIKLTSTSVK